MQIITLPQPWATLAVHGAKTMHVTDLPSDYEGEVAVYTPALDEQALARLSTAVQYRYVYERLAALGYTLTNLPLDGIVGTLKVGKPRAATVDSLPAVKETRFMALCGQAAFNFGKYFYTFSSPNAYKQAKALDGKPPSDPQQFVWELPEAPTPQPASAPKATTPKSEQTKQDK